MHQSSRAEKSAMLRPLLFRWGLTTENDDTDNDERRGVNITRGEVTVKELASLIRRRHDDRVAENGHRPSEERYEEGCRRHAQAVERQELVSIYLFNIEHIERLRRTFDDLIAQRRLKANRAAAAPFVKDGESFG
jgi:hypothetical protein